jgi:ribosomal 30S subunit maturation factor RimM
VATAFCQDTEQFTVVGRVVKAHGVNGGVKIRPYHPYGNHFAAADRLILAGDKGRRTTPLAITRKHGISGNTMVVHLESIDSRAEAELTIGMDVLIPVETPAPSPESPASDTWRGHTVSLANGTVLGIAAGLLDNGASGLLVVDTGEAELLIPACPPIIRRQGNGVIVVEPPPGLLEINR